MKIDEQNVSLSPCNVASTLYTIQCVRISCEEVSELTWMLLSDCRGRSR